MTDLPPAAQCEGNFLVEVFTEWRDMEPRIVHHRFIGGRLEFFTADSGPLSAEEAPQDAQERYWLARSAFPRIDEWPRQITAIHTAFQRTTNGEKRTLALVSEVVNGEEVLRLRSRDEIWSEKDLSAMIDFYTSLEMV
jgi:hypothetical protein